MQEVYGIDLEDPGCSPAHLARLAAQLGPRSRVSVARDPARAWGDAEYVLAGISDMIADLCYGLAGARGRKPEPLPRPGDARRGAERGRARHARVSPERLDSILGAPRA